jgi:hypothetical protein
LRLALLVIAPVLVSSTSATFNLYILRGAGGKTTGNRDRGNKSINQSGEAWGSWYAKRMQRDNWAPEAPHVLGSRVETDDVRCYGCGMFEGLLLVVSPLLAPRSTKHRFSQLSEQWKNPLARSS